MIYTATITSQGQVTIPSAVRDILKVNKNDQVNFLIEKNRVILEPVPDILDLYGAFKTNKKIPFKKIRKEFGKYMARRHLNALP
jgi:AbrB family looped-hinge helix DNA binding protein